LTESFSDNERAFLMQHNFEGANPLLESISSKNYQEIRNFKLNFYSADEKEKVQKLQDYF
jgi:hypothetical protein